MFRDTLGERLPLHYLYSRVLSDGGINHVPGPGIHADGRMEYAIIEDIIDSGLTLIHADGRMEYAPLPADSAG